VLDSHQPALILEDDALLAHTVPALLDKLSSQTDIDLVTLEIRARKKIVGRHSTPITPDLHLRALFQDRTGAAGYVLWPRGAQKLLAKAETGHVAIADAFISSHYALKAFQVEPAAIVQLDMCGDYGLSAPLATTSSIGSVDRPVAAQSPWRFTGRRLMAQLHIAARILSVWHKAERRYITLNKQHFE
jgi:glycosyl transferase family 25